MAQDREDGKASEERGAAVADREQDSVEDDVTRNDPMEVWTPAIAKCFANTEIAGEELRDCSTLGIISWYPRGKVG